MQTSFAGPAGAVISECGGYRYALWRNWDTDAGQIVFIGLNPSTADASADDPTLRRCVGFARAWGYGGVVVGNLFALRSTRPSDLRSCADPVGPENDGWLDCLSGKSDRLVLAWGNGGSYLGRQDVMAGKFGYAQCLGVTRSGSPRHPLYTPAAAELRPYTALEGAINNEREAA